MVLDGPINGVWFQAYIEQVLVPELRPSDIVIMDNLGSHKGAGVRAAIEATGSQAPVPSALQPRLQSDRKRLLKAQGTAAKGGGANGRRPVEPHQRIAADLHAAGMRQLLRRCWL
jgi:hypothetical protein